MLSLIVYGVCRLQEMRGRPIRQTEILDVYRLLQKRFGVAFCDSEEEYIRALERLVDMGYLEKSGGSYAVTEAGRRVVEALKCSSSYVNMLKKYVDKAVEEYANTQPCKGK